MEGMWAVTKIDLNNRKRGVCVSYDGTSGGRGRAAMIVTIRRLVLTVLSLRGPAGSLMAKSEVQG